MFTECITTHRRNLKIHEYKHLALKQQDKIERLLESLVFEEQKPKQIYHPNKEMTATDSS